MNHYHSHGRDVATFHDKHYKQFMILDKTNMISLLKRSTPGRQTRGTLLDTRNRAAGRITTRSWGRQGRSWGPRSSLEPVPRIFYLASGSRSRRTAGIRSSRGPVGSRGNPCRVMGGAGLGEGGPRLPVGARWWGRGGCSASPPAAPATGRGVNTVYHTGSIVSLPAHSWKTGFLGSVQFLLIHRFLLTLDNVYKTCRSIRMCK